MDGMPGNAPTYAPGTMIAGEQVGCPAVAPIGKAGMGVGSGLIVVGEVCIAESLCTALGLKCRLKAALRFATNVPTPQA